jgi:RHH-type proline utilization regulon transcriptional repressor/proline dehydrogenase/delta 1-pyrroline-5-carboxylate dehydrogenase
MPSKAGNTMLDVISKVRLEDESSCVLKLKKQLAASGYNHADSAKLATKYIEKFRKNTGNIGLEEFFRQYGLDTKEGLAVMSLAEALLRIPDSTTANEFIHEALSSADWKIGGKSTSSIVKASSLGLKLAKTFLELGSVASSVLDPVVRESIKQSLKLVGDHFVMGETTKAAIKHAGEYEAVGFTMSYDMLGEGARTEAQATHYLQNYLRGVEEVASSADKTKDLYARPGISVKLSALYSKYKLTNKRRF